LGAVVVEAVRKAARAQPAIGVSSEAAIKKAAKVEGAHAAVAIGEKHGFAPDEVAAVLGGRAAREINDALFGNGGAPDGEPEPASASELVGLALSTLKQIMRKGPQDGPRVAAAKEVFRRDEAERAPGGKKAVAKEAAERRFAAGGKFAPPPPPGARLQ
jgi:hypothetical protein